MAESKKFGTRVSSITKSPNPFLLSREQFAQISLTKTGYRISTDYINVLMVLKTIKKGYTLEAVLHEILTFYFENSPEGSEAVKKAQDLFS